MGEWACSCRGHAQGCVAWGQRGGVRDSRSSWAMLVHGHGDCHGASEASGASGASGVRVGRVGRVGRNLASGVRVGRVP